MKDVELAIRIAYFNLLNGILVGGKAIPFFDKRAPYGTPEPYIVCFGMAQVADNTKSEFGTSLTVELLVYQSNVGDFGGSKQADQISDAIVQAVIPAPGETGILPVGLQVVTSVLVGLNGEFIKHDTKDTYRKRITIEHLISQGV